MGVFTRGNRLWFRFKGPDGKWRNIRSVYVVGQERAAAKAFAELEDRIEAGREILGDRAGAITLQEYAETKWFPHRREILADPSSDEGRLRIHVFPRIGSMPLEDIRPRHLVAMFRAVRASKKLAPKSIHNLNGVVSALFRDAALDGLIDNTPCILDRHVLGPNVDKNPEWRGTAHYAREELAALIWDERVPADRRVLYALQGVGGLRHGEAAGLRWRHYDAAMKPLGRLTVATSYDKGRTKTQTPRYQAVHPALAAVLARWKLSGWAEMMGRTPEPDDIVVPTPKPTNKGPRVKWGSMRDDGYSWKRLAKDQATLGLRHRRGHDLRRTFISLARTDGADKDILARGTHSAPRAVIENYSTFDWQVLCREVAKLQLKRTDPTSESDMPVTPLVTRPLEATDSTEETDLEAAGIEPVSETPRGVVQAQSSAVHVDESGTSGKAPSTAAGPDSRACNGVTKKPYRPPAVASAQLPRRGRR